MLDEQLAEPEKDPSDSQNSAEPLTDSQRAQIEALGGGETSPDREITQAEAAQLIDQLGHRTGRESG